MVEESVQEVIRPHRSRRSQQYYRSVLAAKVLAFAKSKRVAHQSPGLIGYSWKSKEKFPHMSASVTKRPVSTVLLESFRPHLKELYSKDKHALPQYPARGARVFKVSNTYESFQKALSRAEHTYAYGLLKTKLRCSGKIHSVAYVDLEYLDETFG